MTKTATPNETQTTTTPTAASQPVGRNPRIASLMASLAMATVLNAETQKPEPVFADGELEALDDGQIESAYAAAYCNRWHDAFTGSTEAHKLAEPMFRAILKHASKGAKTTQAWTDAEAVNRDTSFLVGLTMDELADARKLLEQVASVIDERIELINAGRNDRSFNATRAIGDTPGLLCEQLVRQTVGNYIATTAAIRRATVVNTAGSLKRGDVRQAAGLDAN